MPFTKFNHSQAANNQPPWIVEELDACFVVRDSDGQQLADVYFEDEPGRRSAAKPLSKKNATDRGGLLRKDYLECEPGTVWSSCSGGEPVPGSAGRPHHRFPLLVPHVKSALDMGWSVRRPTLVHHVLFA